MSALVALGSVALLPWPQLPAWQDRHLAVSSSWLPPGGQVLLDVYNGYFGAGAGVMVLTWLPLTVDRHIPPANAPMNMPFGVAS